MSEQAISLPARAAATGPARRLAAGSLIWGVLPANAAAIVWQGVHGGNVTDKSAGDILTSAARLTGC